MIKSEVELARAKRAKSIVLDLLRDHPRVAKVGVAEGRQGSAEVVVFLKKGSTPEPVLPSTVATVPVTFREFNNFAPSQPDDLVTSTYRSNRQKMVIDAKKIITHLAAKFGKKVSYGVPFSFKLTNKITVVILSYVGETGDSYRLEVKALQGPGMKPPFVADMTVNQMSPATATSDFISRCEDGIAPLHESIYLQ